MTLIYLVVAVALSALGWLAYGIWRIGAISQGAQIGTRSGTALLLVDLQSVFWDRGPYSDDAKSKTQSIILDEGRTAKAQGFPIVAVRQEWSIPSTKAVARLTMKGQAIEGTAGTALAEPFQELADHVLIKRVQDAFETGELDTLFAELGVGHLRIVGLDRNYCVQKTALAARGRGFGVTVIKDGTLAAAPAQRAEQQMTANGVLLQ